MDDSIRILYVDDDPDEADLTVTALQDEDSRFSITTAASGPAGIAHLSEDEYDCVIATNTLPEQTGIEFLSSVRDVDSELPFILIDRTENGAITRKALSAGVTDYFQDLSRPGQYALLANRIDTVVTLYRTEKERRRQETLFEKAQTIANVGAWEYNVVDGTSHVTDETKRIHGLDPDEDLPPTSSLDYYHPDDRETIREAFTNAVEEGEPYQLDLRLLPEDGDIRWVRTRGEPDFEDGEIVCIRGTLQDITDQKNREAELERQNEQLEQFAQIVSHDIRNPLQVAKGYLEEAQRTGSDEAFEQIRQANERIETILADVLELAKQGHQISDRESLDVGEVAKQAWQTVATDEITLKVIAGSRIEADPDRLRQLFENLFRNSVEHAGAGVTVTVGPIDPMPTTTRVDGERRSGFYVSDDGPGIPVEQREAVFESGVTTSDDGTGFGLAIVEQIAKAHGWDVQVTEGRVGGVRFEFIETSTRSGR